MWEKSNVAKHGFILLDKFECVPVPPELHLWQEYQLFLTGQHAKYHVPELRPIQEFPLRPASQA